MDIEVKKLAKQQYLSYFKIWFMALGILAVIAIFIFIGNMFATETGSGRDNSKAPKERVYDNANVLTSSEEDKLREIIEKAEEQIQCDIVLVTIDQPMEMLSDEEIEEYGYRYNDWESNMMDYANDFYDYNDFGYNESGGDGVLLLDNWYMEGTSESQAGSWLSTSGEVYESFSEYDIDMVLDEVYYALDGGAYKGYKAYVEEVVRLMNGGGDISVFESNYLLGAIFIPIVVAVVFVLVNMKSKEGKVTTTASTYVENGSTRMNICTDNFIRKHVTTRIIQSDSSGGSRSGGGRGGSHRSSSGRSHGGGGRRR